MTDRPDIDQLAKDIRDGLNCGPPARDGHEEDTLDIANDALDELVVLARTSLQALVASSAREVSVEAELRELKGVKRTGAIVCVECGRDLHGYVTRRMLCRYCDGTAE